MRLWMIEPGPVAASVIVPARCQPKRGSPVVGSGVLPAHQWTSRLPSASTASRLPPKLLWIRLAGPITEGLAVELGRRQAPADATPGTCEDAETKGRAAQ